jgi:hydrogenase maturation protease
MSRSSKLLVAGVGNVFFGDDAFGVEVVRQLRFRPLPGWVEIADFGIRGFDLACALGRYQAAILIDLVSRGGPPGTLYVLDPGAFPQAAGIDPHLFTPDRVLSWVGPDRPAFLRLLGCEPASLEPNPDGTLSEPVAAAAAEAVRLVERISQDWRAGLCDHHA